MAGHGKKRKRGAEQNDHPDERWLVTYADLMTLLVALFMVLFSISSVNKSKFETLQHSLQDAFSGRILPGGKSIKESGGTDNIATPAPDAPTSTLQPYVGGRSKESTQAAGQTKEQQDFTKLKQEIDAYAAQKGLSGKVKTAITPDGLSIRLLTDNLLFDSGSAIPRRDAMGLLSKLANVLGSQPDHQLVVEGNTDDVPIRSGEFPDNWALSTSRAESIVRTFAHDGITPKRMTAAGRGEFKPVAPNTTAGGRSLNRRVEILVPRVTPTPAGTISADIPVIKPNLTPTNP